ncbi:MAG: site-2 protease family protein [Acidobacteria bacterium]|nr:MAG: site-2 protease family protein [Acidobacteriota bacterium]
MPPSALVAALCAGCGTEFAPALLSCPACHRLTHADALERLAAQAEQAEQSSDRAAALCLWREALPLIPPGSKQHEAVAAKVQALGRASWTRRAGPAGAIGLVLWKAKLALVLLLGKAKVLLLGLTKVSTLATMLLSLGVYWTAWGWKFALGVVVSIYVHEIGHVAALQRLGIRASAPMFVPGFGAFVRLEQHPTTEAEDAHVGLAGPLWGLGATLVAYAAFLASGAGALAAIAQWSARINLFNLLPVWQLDGSRGFHALSRAQHWVVVAAVAALWLLTREGLLVLLLGGTLFTTLGRKPAEKGNANALGQYLFLLLALSALSAIPVRVP